MASEPELPTWAEIEREYRSRLRAFLVGQLGFLNLTGELLDSDQRWDVEEARGVLREWDNGRHGPEGKAYDRERVLAGQVRALLTVIDQVAPKPAAATAREEGR